MPSPPCERLSERSTWVNSSNTSGSTSGGMPTPVSRIGHAHAVAVGLDGQRTRCPPGSVYLAALFSRFENTCASRTRSPYSLIGSGGTSADSVSFGLLDLRPAHLEGGLDHLLNRQRLGRQTQLAAGDARHVEQVVDQPDHLPTCRSSRSRCAAHRVAGVARQPHDLQGVADRGERVAQLVGERREELVLAPVGVAQCRRWRWRQFLGPLLHLPLQFGLGPLLHERVADGALQQRGVSPAFLQVVGGPGLQRFQVGRDWPWPVSRMTGPGSPSRAGLAQEVEPGLRAEPVVEQEDVVLAGADRLQPGVVAPASSRAGTARRGCRRAGRG